MHAARLRTTKKKKIKPKEFLVIFLDLWLYAVKLILDKDGMSKFKI